MGIVHKASMVEYIFHGYSRMGTVQETKYKRSIAIPWKVSSNTFSSGVLLIWSMYIVHSCFADP